LVALANPQINQFIQGSVRVCENFAQRSCVFLLEDAAGTHQRNPLSARQAAMEEL